jgi:hypothetical protein
MDTVGSLSDRAGSRRVPFTPRCLGLFGPGLPQGSLARARKWVGRAWQLKQRALAAGLALIAILGPSHFVRNPDEAGIASVNYTIRIVAFWPGVPGAPKAELLAWRTGPVIRTLECLEWSPAGPAAPPQDACMADSVAISAQQRHRAAVKPSELSFPVAPDGEAPSAASEATTPEPIFSGSSGSDGLIRVNPRDPGSGIPARTCMAGGGGSAQVSAGDRGSLPGRSTRYRVIWLVCPHCSAKMACLFYDQGDVPVCVNEPHGTMEVLA